MDVCVSLRLMPEDDLSIPSMPESISPTWLTTMLHRAGVLDRAAVVGIDVTPIAAGSGFVGQTARLHVAYDTRETGAPATVFAKLSSADPAVRQQLRKVGLYETEAGFYRDVALQPAFPLRVPRPYLSQYDEGTSASILLLEDLRAVEFGDNLTGCSATDARIAVRQLGLLHAYFWESASLKELSWLRALTDETQARAGMYQAMLPRFEQRCAEFLTPSLREAVRRFASVIPEYSQQCSHGPQTLTHGDFRADNLAFAGRGNGRGVTVFDWQVARGSRGPRDLAYFLSSSMSIDQRRAMEESLLSLYDETLKAGGVEGYSPGDLRRDFQAGLGAPLTTWVIAGGMLDFSSERGTDLLKRVCERLGAALDDHRFMSYLDELA